MDGVIGKLRVLIGGDTNGIEGAEKRTSKSMKNIEKAAEKTGKVIAAAMVAAAAAITLAARSSLILIDEQSKLAVRLGGTVTGLQALTRAADLSGVQTDKMTRSLDMFNSRLGEAARMGSGPAFDAIQKLGFSLEELGNMDVDERMAALADRFDELGYSTQQQADVLRQFGIRQMEFINLFQGGGDAIRKARSEIEGFGVAVSDVDAVRIEQANDAMSSMGLVMQGVGNQIAVQLAPLLQGLADEFYNLTDESRGFTDTVAWGIDTTIGVMGALSDAVRYLDIGFRLLKTVGLEVVAALNDGWLTVAETVNGVVTNIRRGYNSIADVIPGMQAISEVDPGRAAWVARVKQDTDEARASATESRADLEALAREPLPSDALEQWVADVKARSEEAAAAAVAARKSISLGDGNGEGDSEAEVAAATKRQDQLDSQFEQLRVSLLTEREAEMESYESRLADLTDYLERKMVTQSEYADMSERVERDHQAKMADIEQKANQLRQRMQQETIGRVVSTMDAIGSALESSGDEHFAIVKGISLATALLKGYEAVTSAFAAGSAIGGPPVGFAYAGLAAAATAAQIAQLMSVGPSSSGTPSAASGGSAPSVAPSGGDSGQGPSQSLHVSGFDKNSLFTGDAMRSLAKRLVEFQEDGGRVILD